MSALILPGQEPGREVLHAATELITALVNQYPGIAAEINKHKGMVFNIMSPDLKTLFFSMGGETNPVTPPGTKPLYFPSDGRRY